MSLARRLVADTAVASSAYVSGMTVVALPPSDLDPDPNEMRVYVAGALIYRQFDPVIEQP